MKKAVVFGLIAAAGLASSANAAYRIDVRCTATELNPANPTAMIQIWVNHSGGQGGGNFGPTKFKGSINILGGGSQMGADSSEIGHSVDPFSAGPTPPTNTGAGINNVDSFRGPVPGAVQPLPYGAGDDFVLCYEIPIVVTDFTARELEISATGQGQRITSWTLFLGSWNPRTSGTGIVNPLETATDSLRIPVTPAPGAMALLGLGGLVAGRRRR